MYIGRKTKFLHTGDHQPVSSSPERKFDHFVEISVPDISISANFCPHQEQRTYQTEQSFEWFILSQNSSSSFCFYSGRTPQNPTCNSIPGNLPVSFYRNTKHPQKAFLSIFLIEYSTHGCRNQTCSNADHAVSQILSSI